jgi:hypothetical protein
MAQLTFYVPLLTILLPSLDVDLWKHFIAPIFHKFRKFPIFRNFEFLEAF